MEQEKRENPVVTIFDEESGKYYDVTIDLDLLDNADLQDEERQLLEALLAEAQKEE